MLQFYIKSKKNNKLDLASICQIFIFVFRFQYHRERITMKNSRHQLITQPVHGLLKKSLVAVLLILSTHQAFSATPTYYRVKSGDTLQSIANQYDVTLSKLISINNLKDKNDIKPGDKIYLTDVTALSYRGKTMSYIVQNGDSMSSIAKRFNTKASVLSELNQFESDSERLYVGDKIIVPMQTAPLPVVATPTANVTAVKETTVKPTGTLKTTVTTVVKTQPETFDYQVKSGETLFGIANKFKVDKKELMELNDLDYTAKVNVGQKLLIPGTADRMNAVMIDKSKATATVTTTMAKKPTSTVKSAGTISVDFTNYKVKSGDSLSSLASKYNTTVSGLAKINNLSSDAQLKIGQTIYVPVHDVD